MVEPYKVCDGKPLGERKLWLQDDYVKFIRMAQERIERTGYGVLAFITNHGYLENPTFRGMRQSLSRTFDHLYLLDLHGSSKKMQQAPDANQDDNVFDIQQGVAISVLVKLSTGEPSVCRGDLWGSREAKYEWLAGNAVPTTEWQPVPLESPLYLFAHRDNPHRAEYERGWRLPDIMTLSCPGLITSRDSFAIDVNPEALVSRLEDFANLAIDDGVARTRYFGSRSSGKYPPGDTRGWHLPEARRALAAAGVDKALLRTCMYRPFDLRSIYYSPTVVDWPRTDFMHHIVDRSNLSLCTTRFVEIGRGWEHVFCSRALLQHHSVSVKEVNYVFPLYRAPGSPGGQLEGEGSIDHQFVGSTLSDDFVRSLESTQSLDVLRFGAGDLESTCGPEDVFSYMYAALHSPAYRSRYAEFLRTDFPRIPLTSDRELFRELCHLGARLVTLHLMEATELAPITTYPVAGDNRIENVRYAEPGQGDEKGRVRINSTQYFEGVSPEVWEFHIGGYQVCAKWLKDRKGRLLTYDDLKHYQYVVAALAETITLMGRIDEVIEANGGWPLS
jgi:predicted helicase